MECFINLCTVCQTYMNIPRDLPCLFLFFSFFLFFFLTFQKFVPNFVAALVGIYRTSHATLYFGTEKKHTSDSRMLSTSSMLRMPKGNFHIGFTRNFTNVNITSGKFLPNNNCFVSKPDNIQTIAGGSFVYFKMI